MLLSLDFVYMPSKDVDKDLKYYVDVFGAEEAFNINDEGAHVAMAGAKPCAESWEDLLGKTMMEANPGIENSGVSLR